MEIEKVTKNVNVNVYLAAAKELGHKTDIIDRLFGYVVISSGNHSIEIVESALSVNTQAHSRISRSKFLSSSLLKDRLGNLIPESILVDLDKISDSLNIIREFFNNHPSGIVVKPNSGSLAKGVLVKPVSIEETMNHINKLESVAAHDRFIVLEEYSPAKNEFRFVTYKGKIIDVIKRLSAFVVGDGMSKLNRLIDEKNAYKKNNLLPRIVIDERIINEEKLNSVPEKDKKVVLNNVCNMGMGGEVEVFDIEELNKKYFEISQEIYAKLGINLVGIDFMSDDLTLDPSESNTIINEINSSPMPELSYFARLNDNDPLVKVKELLTNIFEI